MCICLLGYICTISNSYLVSIDYNKLNIQFDYSKMGGQQAAVKFLDKDLIKKPATAGFFISVGKWLFKRGIILFL